MAGMYAPLRNHSGDMFMSDWAAAWLQRMNGWESRIYELAGFDPSRFRRLKAENTILDIAKAWKTKKALSEYAWNDR